MWLRQQEAGLTLQEIGARFGNIHYSAVSQNIRRLKRSWGKERLRRQQQAVMSRLAPYPTSPMIYPPCPLRGSGSSGIAAGPGK